MDATDRDRSGLLSWGCQFCPSVDINVKRPLPVSTLARESNLLAWSLLGIRPAGVGFRPSARSCHSPNSFRPCRSSRLRRLAPLDIAQVCCTLQPTMGFATFQGGRTRVPGGSLGTSFRPASAEPRGPSRPSAADELRARPPKSSACSSPSAGGSHAPGPIPGGATPFEAFPSPAAVPRHRGHCPLAVGPDLLLPPPGFPVRDVAAVAVARRDLDLRALLRKASPLRPTDVSAGKAPDASMGFCIHPGFSTHTLVAICMRAESRMSGSKRATVRPHFLRGRPKPSA